MAQAERRQGRGQTMWLEGGVLRCEILPGRQTAADARENVRIIGELAQGQRLPMLIDVRRGTAVSREARLIYGGPENAKNVAAVAFLVDSPLSRVLGNFFLGLKPSAYPIRLFGEQAAALAWLQDPRR